MNIIPALFLVILFISVIYLICLVCQYRIESAAGDQVAKRNLIVSLVGVSLAVMLVCLMGYLNNKITFEARQAAFRIFNSEPADISKEDEWAVLKAKHLMNNPLSMGDTILLRIAESKIRSKNLEDQVASDEVVENAEKYLIGHNREMYSVLDGVRENAIKNAKRQLESGKIRQRIRDREDAFNKAPEITKQYFDIAKDNGGYIRVLDNVKCDPDDSSSCKGEYSITIAFD